MAIQIEDPKDPNAKLDYGIDWSLWLETGETISASIWTLVDGIVGTAASFSSTQTLIWISGGDDGKSYHIANRITTSAGRIDERTLLIKVKSR
jgi:hypothetical protein